MLACTTTASSVASSVVTTYAPVTSIEVDANSLFERIGCGPNSGQAYKYVVVVYEAGPDGLRTKATPDAISITDCYTDALFQNLSNSQLFGAATFFSFDVFVFDEPTFTARETCDHLNTNDLNALIAEFTSDLDAGDAGSTDPCDLATAANRVAQDALFSTTCFGQQLPNVESIAACDALQD
jgi:hypothetical protein